MKRKARENSIHARGASLPETPTVQLDFKQKHICLWKIKGTGEKWEGKGAKRLSERAIQSTKEITVCGKHWNSHASTARSLPPSFFRMLHSSHGHTVLCWCVKSANSSVCLLYLKTFNRHSPKEQMNIPVQIPGVPVSPEASLRSRTYVWLLCFPHKVLQSQLLHLMWEKFDPHLQPVKCVCDWIIFNPHEKNQSAAWG